MASAFVGDILMFGRIGIGLGVDGNRRGGTIEYFAAADRVSVIGADWHYVMVDDGGLVRRYWSGSRASGCLE